MPHANASVISAADRFPPVLRGEDLLAARGLGQRERGLVVVHVEPGVLLQRLAPGNAPGGDVAFVRAAFRQPAELVGPEPGATDHDGGAFRCRCLLGTSTQ